MKMMRHRLFSRARCSLRPGLLFSRSVKPRKPGIPVGYSLELDSNLQGFIHHPVGYPIEYRAIAPPVDHTSGHTHHDQAMGLYFECAEYYPPGSYLEVCIRIRGESCKFSGQVVLVKNCDEYFETGIWLECRTQANRLRIVEQICHIESYLRHKRQYEGPFVSRENVAREWINRFAASFPSFV
jgi:hypothetical protein